MKVERIWSRHLQELLKSILPLSRPYMRRGLGTSKADESLRNRGQQQFHCESGRSAHFLRRRSRMMGVRACWLGSF